MSKITNPFKIPPVTHTKVTLDEIHKMLSERVNQHYMPTSNGRIKSNSNPEYVTKNLPGYSDFPDVDFANGTSGFFAFDDKTKPDIFVYLFLHSLHIVVNLKTLATVVKCEDGDLIFNWSATPDKGIAIDRYTLRDVIEQWVY